MDPPAAVSGKSRMDCWYYPCLGFRQSFKIIAPFQVWLLTWGGIPLAIANPTAPTCSVSVGRPDIAQPLIAKTQKRSNTARSPSQSPPNLWWAKEQYDPFAGRLIERWQVNREHQSVEVMVNRQLWSSLDYLGRYRLVSQLGSITRESRYDLNILNPQNKCLATYVCEFEMIPYQCELLIEPFDRQGITPQRNPF
jgi:hypothetical protein